MIEEKFMKEYLPLTVIKIDKGVGSFITINLKDNIQNKKFYLWIYLTDWEIIDIDSKKVLLNSDNISDLYYKTIFQKFIGTTLNQVFIIEQGYLEFVFDNKLKIVLMSNLNYYDLEDDLFMFFDNYQNIIISYSIKNNIYIEMNN